MDLVALMGMDMQFPIYLLGSFAHIFKSTSCSNVGFLMALTVVFNPELKTFNVIRGFNDDFSSIRMFGNVRNGFFEEEV